MSTEPTGGASPQLIRVAEEQVGERLDRIVGQSIRNVSRAYAQRLIEQGAVTLNGNVARSSARVRAGDLVSVTVPPPAPQHLVGSAMPLEIVYENADVLVVDKPAGLVVHPAPGHSADTLVNALVARYPDIRIGPSLRPGVVHRLDKDTSGLMVVAKNDGAMACLVKQMKSHEVVKEYLALVEGMPASRQGLIEAPIGRHPEQRKRMAVISGGREARTHFAVVEVMAGHSLLRVRLETGRTHQIRVHLASIGHPIEGDTTYGGRRPPHCAGLSRQFLHATHLAFRLPGSGEMMVFDSELPLDLRRCLADLKRRSVG